jgi:hypothetical protein
MHNISNFIVYKESHAGELLCESNFTLYNSLATVLHLYSCSSRKIAANTVC